MNFNINDCFDIIKKYPNFVHKVDIVDGYKIHQFDYLLSIYEQFKVHPYANELRGISFIELEDGTFKRNLMLHKFFNLNENLDYLEENFKKFPVSSVTEKMDGSIIRFVKLPNGKFVAKSKYSFSSDQAIMAQKLFNVSPELQDLVLFCDGCGIALFFEYVSPSNQIVVRYEQPELVVIQARIEATGEYIEVSSIPNINKFKIAKKYDFKTIEDIKEYLIDKSNFEGFVVVVNGTYIKMKCSWYIKLHQLRDYISHEDIVIDLILTDKLDDAIITIKEVVPDLYLHVVKIRDFIYNYIDVTANKIIDILTKADSAGMNRKSFAITYSKSDMFGLFMASYGKYNDRSYVISVIKKTLAKECYRLDSARCFLKSNGFNS